jgi:hypothetical protein
MQRTAALSRIEEVRFNVGPKSHQPTTLGNMTCDFPADDSRGVEAATAAPTHAGHKGVQEERSSNPRRQSHRRNLPKVSILNPDPFDQLNFEFARNKNSMTVFMIRLRRVYQARTTLEL